MRQGISAHHYSVLQPFKDKSKNILNSQTQEYCVSYPPANCYTLLKALFQRLCAIFSCSAIICLHWFKTTNLKTHSLPYNRILSVQNVSVTEDFEMTICDLHIALVMFMSLQ